MEEETLVVRKVDKQISRKFKLKAMERRLKLGRALSEAMDIWTNTENKKKVKDSRKLLKIKPIDFGKGTENLSTNLDKVLYG